MTPDYTLYLVTDRPLAGGRPLASVVAEAIEGGVTVVQLREKQAGGREFYEQALAVHAVTRRYGVPLIIDDRLDIMLAVGAEGIHVGSGDLPAERARALAPGKILGCSAGSMEELRRAEAAGADYIGVGPVFPTPTKADAGPALGLDGLRRLVAATPLPCVAIGGIHPENAGGVAAAGVAGIAVVSAVMGQPRPAEAARVLRAAFISGAGRGTRLRARGRDGLPADG